MGYLIILFIFVWLGTTALFQWIYEEGWTKSFVQVSIGYIALAIIIWLTYMGLGEIKGG